MDGIETPISDRKTVGIYAIAAVLCGFNWFIYVWAVTAGYIVECSLGYYINPLLSVLLGVVFLRERLRPFQWVSIVWPLPELPTSHHLWPSSMDCPGWL